MIPLHAISLLAALALAPQPDPSAVILDRVRVVADTTLPISVSELAADTIAKIDASHPNELMQRVPGVWISRGSGQEQLTAIRSPVLTGAGACGAFLWTENGVPIRPAGWCNVNNLFELNTEQAESIEVLRGPGTALHGANALHGVINVRTESAFGAPGLKARGTLGAHDYEQLQARWRSSAESSAWLASAVSTRSESFRLDEGYRQHKLHLAQAGGGELGDWHAWLSATDLQQQTAGFIVGRDAYRQRSLRRRNDNPEAFRNASAARAAVQLNGALNSDWTFQAIPYVRADEQDFLQHFSPGQPLEENSSHSLGVLSLFRRSFDQYELALGMDLEWADGRTREVQAQALTTGSPQQQAIRPAGVHYDYAADTQAKAVFIDSHWSLSERTRLELGLRAEHLGYRYDNRSLDGNTREDGSVCGFGGCLFNRPADRSDRFLQWAPKLALTHRFNQSEAWARLARGFRFPQASELYRLQRGQDVADLETETLDQFELGYRRATPRLWLEAAAFTAIKHHFIFRDANGFNESQGRTRHQGIELAIGSDEAAPWSFSANASYALHRYDFDRALSAGEAIASGNEVDTAPRQMAGLRVQRNTDRWGAFELELIHQGGYFVDANNSARYPGHQLANLRWSRPLSASTQMHLRVMNIRNTRYAERADFAFGNYRYFPGDGRALFIAFSYEPES